MNESRQACRAACGCSVSRALDGASKLRACAHLLWRPSERTAGRYGGRSDGRSSRWRAYASADRNAAAKRWDDICEQVISALRGWPVREIEGTKLLDLKLEMGDQHFRAGVYCLRASRNGFGFNACGALGDDHRMRAGKIWCSYVSTST